MTLRNRVLMLCNECGITIYRVEKDCNFANGSIMKWKKSSPKAEKVVKLALYFNVSADYLLGLTDNRKPLEHDKVDHTSLSPALIPSVFEQMSEILSEQRFVNTAKIYHELPDEMRERAYMLIYGIAVGLGLNVEKIIGNNIK